MNDKHKVKILIVDDDLAVLKLLIRALGGTYNLLVAPTAYDIETLIHHHEPELLILDIGLPEENGQELCHNLRSRSDFDHMAILFLSGLHEAKVAAATLQAGADGYLTKPFDVQILRNTIEYIIGEKREAGALLVR